jgi:hypothetical protein
MLVIYKFRTLSYQKNLRKKKLESLRQKEKSSEKIMPGFLCEYMVYHVCVHARHEFPGNLSMALGGRQLDTNYMRFRGGH